VVFFSGFVAFSYLGTLAKLLGKPIESLVLDGPELVFIAYSEALSQLPKYMAPLFAELFFLTLLFLGIDSMFAWTDVIISFLEEREILKIIRKEYLSLIVCLLLFLSGILFSTGIGLYLLCIFDHYVPMILLFIIGLSEALVIGYYYGAFTFVRNFRMATEKNIGIFWPSLWKILPLLMVILIGLAIYAEITVPLTVATIPLPLWATVLGWCLAVIPILVIPICGIIPFIRNCTTNDEKARLIADVRYQGL